MPSHARRVKAYSDPVPLFQRYGAEDQLRAMYDPMVQLKSGGYIIINPTEALVSIDINSGRSTKEHGIEATALHTNLEAAKEIARQLRLRDMAGLVVIDFIDMEYPSNVRKVEKAMKDALKNDRARIQVGRISSFGLMEMSRQRLRTGVLEATTRPCPHCDGTGLVRTASSAGLSALRLIEDEAARGKGTQIRLAASTEAAIYLLNEKRADLVEIEQRYGVTVEVVPEGENEGAKMSISSSGPRPTHAPKFEPIIDEDDDDVLAEDEDDFAEAEAEERGARQPRSERSERAEGDEDGARKKKRRRRRGGRSRNRDREEGSEDEAGYELAETGAGSDTNTDADAEGEDNADTSAFETGEDGEARPKKRRRRGGRGRKRREGGEGEAQGADAEGNNDDALTGDESPAEAAAESVASVEADAVADPEAPAEEAPAEKPKRVRAPRKKKVAEPAAEEVPAEIAPELAGEATEAASGLAEAAAEAPGEKPKRKRAPRKAKLAAEAAESLSQQVAEDMAVIAPPDGTPETAEAMAAETGLAREAPAGQAAPEADTKPRRGWWQRTFGE
jgi:ribonuclease E